MRAVADTNVLAYYLLRTEPFYEEARNFWRIAEDVWAPDSWRVELLNVLFLAVRAGVVEQPQTEILVVRAEALITHTYPVENLAQASLRLAISRMHPVYDTVFASLARQEKIPVATFDRKLLDRFPEQARRPAEILTEWQEQSS